MQDLTYGGNSGTPGVGGGLDGVPDMGFYNILESDHHLAGTVQRPSGCATPHQKDHVTFTIYWVPVTTTDYNGPNRAANCGTTPGQRCIFRDMEPCVLANAAEPGARQRRRISLERS